MPCLNDDPDQISPAEVVANSKAGCMMITKRPFLHVKTGDGMPIGSSVVSSQVSGQHRDSITLAKPVARIQYYSASSRNQIDRPNRPLLVDPSDFRSNRS